MIKACLMWSLKPQGFLSKKQCDFRKNHSTLDHPIRFETFIRNAFVKKEHILTIFFDLEKTQRGSMAFLQTSGILVSEAISPVLFKVSYLTAKVRVGSTLHEQGMGVPQGSILSPALFSIKINTIVKAVLKGTDCIMSPALFSINNIVKAVLNSMDCSLFVGNFALFVSGKMLNRVERAMQLCVNNIQEWASEWL